MYLSGPVQHLEASQKLTQKQVMSQKLIQSIKLMAMPIAELRETIHQEAERNPALEIVREAGEIDEQPAEESRVYTSQIADSDPFQNSSDPGYQPTSKGDSDSKQRFIEGTVSREESLSGHLIEQLGYLNISENTRNLAERIIWNLDGDGFHLETPESVLENIDNEVITAILRLIHRLEPIGCGCKDWRESLKVQAEIRGDAPEQFNPFIDKSLPLMENQKFDEARAALDASPEDWEELNSYIRLLNPFPGRLYNSETIPYIIPDLIVKHTDSGPVLTLNDEVLPILRIDPEFEKLKDGFSNNKETTRRIKDYSQQAQYFINSLTQRDNTLLKTAQAIVESQRDFFIGGPRHLKPLILKDIAEKTGVHGATVSRITTNKYIQTEWGIFELKYFFTNSISGTAESSSPFSKTAVKEILKTLISTDGDQKISDQKLCNLLQKRGIKIARRTVAKYRKELNLPASFGS
ncbi:MAG: RNA polymerase sigma-54 factor [Spirochaeta sp. LUC14_002_19_P3]|nr:MAG: RNA polymerase sigma-54 factor [Spirochaeta sp. LUC14_002_19_P3]